jgi:putative transposase
LNNVQSLSHSVWDCKYHIVWIPKYRRRVLYGRLRKHLGSIFRELARQRESEILEGHLCPDHVHMYIAIPPKYAVAQVVGYIKGKSAIHIARQFGGRARNFVGENFWAPEFQGQLICAAGQGRVIQRVGYPSRKVGQPPGSKSLEAGWQHTALSVGQRAGRP